MGNTRSLVTETGGLCGFDRYSFLSMGDNLRRISRQEYSRLELAAIKAILSVEKNPRFISVDFSNYMDIVRYDHLGMSRGEHLFSVFSGEFGWKKKDQVFIYVVIRTETKSGMKFQPELFARSLPTTEQFAGRWMNTADVWEFIDTSIFEPTTVMATV